MTVPACPQRRLVVLAHNLRSVFNVGSLLRTSDVFAAERVYVTGFTPYPAQPGMDDPRDPELQARLTKRLAKSAAGSELTMPVSRCGDVFALIGQLRSSGYAVAGLEIDDDAVPLPEYRPPERVALLLGDEVRGIDPALREACDVLLQIPMFGQKGSLNVSVAAGIALFGLRTAG